jgi:hypothetical protein
MHRLGLDVRIKSGKTHAAASLRDFTISDTRLQSTNHAYRDIFCRSTLATVEVLPPVKSSASLATNNSSENEVSLVEKADDLENGHQDDLLSVLFDGTEKEKTVKVLLDNLTAILAPPTILALIAVTLSNLNSLLSILEALNPPPTPGSKQTDPSRKPQRKRSSYVEPPRDTSSFLHVAVNVTNPRILILQNPSDINTPALVGRSSLSCTFVRDVSSEIRSDVKEILHVEGECLELFLLASVSDPSQPLQVLEPSSLAFHQIRTSEGGIQLQSQLSLDLSAISVSVTLLDLVHLSKIANQMNGSSDKNDTSSKTEEIFEEKTSLKGKNNGSAVGTQVGPISERFRKARELSRHFGVPSEKTVNICIVDLFVNSGAIRIQVIDDLGANNSASPLISLGMEPLSLHLSGCPTVGTFEGDINPTLFVDFFNVKVYRLNHSMFFHSPLFVYFLFSRRQVGNLSWKNGVQDSCL